VAARGIITAAGLSALRDGPKHLAQDHENACRLAEGLAEILPGNIDSIASPSN
jgi:threonine aldolase